MIELDKVVKAIKVYNKYRAPEAVAKLHSIEGDKIIFILKGSFRFTCGFYDWIDDLRIELMDSLNRDIEIEKIENMDFGIYRIIFRIK